jgi:hypothetical protein
VEQLDHEALVKKLAALPDDERRAIVREAQARANARVTLPWSALRAVIGVVHGESADAVDDTNALYDV